MNIFKIAGILFLSVLFVFGSKSAIAKTYTTNASGNWNSTATWGGTASTPGASAATDTVIINSGITVTLTASPTNAISSITIQSTGVLLLNANTTLTSTNVLAGAGTLTMGANSTLNIGGTATLTTLNCTANIPNTVIYNSTTANQTVKGGMTYYHLVISKGGTSYVATLGGAITCQGNLTIKGGSFTPNGGLSDGGFANAITGSGNDTLFLQDFASYTSYQTSAPFYPANFGLDSVSGYNQINFYGAGSFTLPGPLQFPAAPDSAFNYLGIGGTGTKTSVANPLNASYIVYASGGALALNYGLSTSGIEGNSSAVLDIEDGGGASAYTIPFISSNIPPTISSPLGELIVNRAAGVTLGAPLTLAAAGSLTNALVLNNGILNTTSTNILTISYYYSTAVINASTSSFVNGPMVEYMAPSESAGSITHTFPFGDITGPSYNPLKIIGSVTTSGSSATVLAQLFTGATGGSPGALVTSLNSNHYWSASVTANASNITTMGRISLQDNSVISSSAVCCSATQTGTYNAIASSAVNPVVTTKGPGPYALGYFVIGTVNTNFNFNGVKVGSGQQFTSLTNPGGLFEALNVVQVLQQNDTAYITGDLTTATEGGTGETGTDSLNALSGGYTLTIMSDAGTLRTISGTGVTTGAPMIGINGASNIVFDGRNNGSGQYLLFRNTNATPGNAGATIQFVNGATSCTLVNCYIENNSSSASKAPVMIGNAGTNTGITISGNSISPPTGDNTGSPANSIYINGSNTYTVWGNNIYNFSGNGIKISQGLGNNCKVTGNSIYQTASFAAASTAMTGINISFSNTSNNDTIQGNFIGGNASALSGGAISGTWNCTSSASTFFGMQSSVQQTLTVIGNTIGGIAFTTSASATTAPGVFTGIYVQAGAVNIGGASAGNGNVIGNSSTPITVTCSANGNYVAAIYMTSSSANTVQNNVISGITCKGSAITTGFIFNAINTAGTGAISISGNTIGVSTLNANDIIIGSTTATNTGHTIYGIQSANTGTGNIISGNKVQGITALVTTMGTSPVTFSGIAASGTAAYTISSNSVGSSSANSIIIGTSSNPATQNPLTINGILASTSGAVSIQTNTVQNITGTSVAVITLNGIAGTGITGSNALTIGGNPPVTYGNTVTTLSAASANLSTVLRGINVTGPTTTALTIQGNTISTLQSSTANAGVGVRAAIIGILDSIAASGESVDQNTVSGITSTTGSNTITISGVTLGASTASSGTCTANKIYGLTVGSAINIIIGINAVYASSTTGWTVANNMITLSPSLSNTIYGIRDEITASGSLANYYFNSVYLGGSSSSANTYCFYRASTGKATESIKNNIFINERGGAGPNVCIANGQTSSFTGWTASSSNYNILGSDSSNQATIGYWNGSVRTFTQWKGTQPGGSAGDANSYSGTSSVPPIPPADSIFTNKYTDDLHLLSDMSLLYPGTALASPGTFPLGIDIDDQNRNATTPDIGTDEFGCGCNFQFTVNNVFLQGYYLGAGKMSPLLHLLGLSADNTATDTVTIVLYNASTHLAVDSSTNILHSNGSDTCLFKKASSGTSYWIVVKHRNSLTAWSAAAIIVTAGGSYDFSAGGGYNGSLIKLDGTYKGIYSGDINRDGHINSTDKSLLQSALSGFLIGAYNVNDITGDGFVDEDDYRIIENNVPLNRTVVHPF